MLAPDVLAFVAGALPSPPARVLEIGAGDGALAGALAQRGYDVLAIDPAADGAGERVRRVALHDLDEPPASFDAAVAVVSLHHVEPLEESLRALGALIRQGGTLVVDEFDVDRFDERAATWWAAHAQSHADHRPQPAEHVAALRGHLHSLAALRAALSESFTLSDTVRGPYLHRWDLPAGMLAVEQERIAAGTLPATGARVTGKRR